VNSPLYVKWGIKMHSNEELRQKYIAEVMPELTKLGMKAPDNLTKRRFL